MGPDQIWDQRQNHRVSSSGLELMAEMLGSAAVSGTTFVTAGNGSEEEKVREMRISPSEVLLLLRSMMRLLGGDGHFFFTPSNWDHSRHTGNDTVDKSVFLSLLSEFHNVLELV